MSTKIKPSSPKPSRAKISISKAPLEKLLDLSQSESTKSRTPSLSETETKKEEAAWRGSSSDEEDSESLSSSSSTDDSASSAGKTPREDQIGDSCSSEERAVTCNLARRSVTFLGPLDLAQVVGDESKTSSSDIHSSESGSETGTPNARKRKRNTSQRNTLLIAARKRFHSPVPVASHDHPIFIIGEEESLHIRSRMPRNRRVFLFNAQGRAVGMEIKPSWTHLGQLLASANDHFKTPDYAVLIDPPLQFVAVYHLDHMAEITELDEIRNDDKLLVSTFNLETSGPLSLPSFANRSHRKSQSVGMTNLPPMPVTNMGRSQSPDLVLVPIVEPSFYPTFQLVHQLNSDKFSVPILKQRSTELQTRAKSDHAKYLLDHMESLARPLCQLWAALNPLSSSSGPSTVPYTSSGTSGPLSSNLLAIPSATIRRPNNLTSHSQMSLSVPDLSGSLSTLPPFITKQPFITPRPNCATPGTPSSPGSIYSHSTSSLPTMAGLGTSGDTSTESTPRIIQPRSSSIPGLRHAFEWERSEAEIKVIAVSQHISDKWDEKSKLKNERSRLMSAEEEKEAKRFEKRSSKAKGLLSQASRSKLGTMRGKDAPSKPPTAAIFDQVTGGAIDESVSMDPSGKIIGQTLERAIHRITADAFPDVAFTKMFLLTYRLYMSPIELLKLIESRWDISSAEMGRLSPVRLRLLTFLKQWLGKHASDFDTHDMRLALSNLGTKLQNQGVPTASKDLESLLFRPRSSVAGPGADDEDEDEDSLETPNPFFPPVGGELFDFHPLEMARQITIIEKEFFDRILPAELLNVAWTTKTKEEKAPNVLAMIRFSNFLVDWMCTEILKPDDTTDRAIAINRFIYVGHYCTELNNFSGTVEVLSALRRSSIFRLKKSWNLLPDRAWNVFEQMELLFEPDSNYKNYRTQLDKSNPPCIPYMGRLLSDILFLEEKESNFLVNTKLLNMVKMEALGSILRTIVDFQSRDYHLLVVEIISSYLSSQEVLNEKQAYALSLEREKRATPPTPRPAEMSPSALLISDVTLRIDVYTAFLSYLQARCDYNLLIFYKQVTSWNQTAVLESDQPKLIREAALGLFNSFITERADKQVWFARDAVCCATIQEIEWKIKEDTAPFVPGLFKPLVENILPTLTYHFNEFKKSIPIPPQQIT